MTGCSAGYCTNSSAKGFKIFKIPKDPERRKKWLENVPKDEQPGKYSGYCEVHFEKKMLMRNTSGNLLLKKDAYPTLFGNFITAIQHADITEMEMETEMDTTIAETVTDINLLSENAGTSTSEDNFVKVDKKLFKKMEKMIVQGDITRRRLRLKLNAANLKIKRLQKQDAATYNI